MAAAVSGTRERAAAPAAATLLVVLLLQLLFAAGGVDAQPALRTGTANKLAGAAAAAPRYSMADILGSITLPPGFVVELYATVSGGARALFSEKRGAHTITYVGSKGSSISAAVDLNSTGAVDYVTVLASGLTEPHGVAVSNNYLYFPSVLNATAGAIWRVKNAHTYALNRTAIPPAKWELVTDKLPSGASHKRRMIRFTKDANVFVTHLGIDCNVCDRPNATGGGLYYTGVYALNVSTVKAATGAQATPRLIAVGMRNAQGMDVHPATGDLYLSEANRDLLGDNRPDCEINRIKAAAVTSGGGTPGTVPFYGFARCYSSWEDTTPYLRPPGPGANVADPDLNANGAALNCSGNGFVRPVQGVGPHATPIGVRFYIWKNHTGYFPKATYHKTLFIAEHGSWNRATKLGARVMLLAVNAATGQAVRHTEFMGGMIDAAANSYRARLVDVSQLPDGSVAVSDDLNNVLYRVRYTG